MGAVLVLFAVILLMKVVGLIALSWLDRPAATLPHPDPCLGPLMDLPLPPPDPERSLLTSLAAGRITRADYRAAMAALAAREAATHPLQTPGGPDS
ncbi:hypothetical protein Aph02nite_48620 [Actinoplanes philippinensis]|uniref:Short C-terminal domain-containing protein n=1 Tax=Actinoplanes philippinensis TaxID=35752 RepID=A0A1I2HWR4_9ACTN|nr:hypothetical protein [Actinoplanes philippinensis]GIE78912.1 hypothetical protein Aph02nite_48620 [Actinoplanes philippinensis]SFF34272.1 hypothetical protein SAMN05421541_10925 [Actinoplanes philippinensis]